MDKMAAILQTLFSNAFSWMNFFYFDKNVIEMCSSASNIGLDNGLVPNKQRAIIWTNDGLFYWHINTSLSLNELSAMRFH